MNLDIYSIYQLLLLYYILSYYEFRHKYEVYCSEFYSL